MSVVPSKSGPLLPELLKYGRLDIFVNNAGIRGEAGTVKPIDEASEDMLDSHFTVNIKGTFLGCKYALRQMKKQDPLSRGDRGWIVNISSIAALVGLPNLSIYTVSKGVVASLTRSVAVDGAPYRVHCNAVCPGYTQTAMLDAALGGIFQDAKEAVAKTIPLGRFGETRDIARAVASSRWGHICTNRISTIVRVTRHSFYNRQYDINKVDIIEVLGDSFAAEWIKFS